MYKPDENRFNKAIKMFDYHIDKAEKSFKENNNLKAHEHLIYADYWGSITAKNNPDRYFKEKEYSDKELYDQAVNKNKELYIVTKFYSKKFEKKRWKKWLVLKCHNQNIKN